MTTFAEIGSLAGGAPESEKSIPARYAAAIGPDPDGAEEPWAPTELGESLTVSLLTIIVRTAPPDAGRKVYQACEDDGVLDRVMDDVRRSVIREIRKVVSA